MEIEKYLNKDFCNVIVLVGVSGSGKSTVANEIKNQVSLLNKNCVILSSDQIRLELFKDENDQTHNEEVFKTI